MKGKLTLTQIRVILILGGVVFLAIAFFVYQNNADTTNEYNTKTQKAQSHVTELEALQSKVTDLEMFTSLYEDDMHDFIQSFPVKITQQKSVYLIYQMMLKSDIGVQSITPGNIAPFYYKGNILISTADKEQAQTQAAKENLSDIQVLDMKDMIGASSAYSINVSGTSKQIYKALDWISENKEKLSVGDVNLVFDKSSGKLTGSIEINFYSMFGNGVAYKEPDTSVFTYGVDGDVFGAFK